MDPHIPEGSQHVLQRCHDSKRQSSTQGNSPCPGARGMIPRLECARLVSFLSGYQSRATVSMPPGSQSVTIRTAARIFPDRTMELYRLPADLRSESLLWLNPEPSFIQHSYTSLTRAKNLTAPQASILCQISGFVSSNRFASLVFLMM